MRQCRLFLYIMCGLFFNHTVKGQVTINEICPTNASIITNYDGEYSDWLEIYNGGPTMNIGGYGITDDSTKPFRFSFPPGYTIASGGKVMVFASSHTNQYPADHWEMAVNAGTVWQYQAGSASLDTNWRNVNFNASLWSTGNGGIGFGDGDDNTILPVCASFMMRKSFSIPDTSQIMKAVFKMDYDDGFVAYLNGVEIARANIGNEGTRPAWNALANYPHEAANYRGLSADSFFIDKTALRLALRNGTNVLAIEVHNSPANSDDMSSIPYLFFGMKSPGLTYIPKPTWWIVPDKDYFNANFKLSRDGEVLYLYNPSGAIADQKNYPVIDINNSYARIPDGSANWCFTSTPTPAASNNSSQCFSSYALAPLFSKEGGYYTGSQIVTLLSPTPGGVIHYTRNGNTPTETDPVYTSPISIVASQTIRARIFATNSLPGPVTTNTYIINGLTHLSTFSITTDSVNLWDYNQGIYTMGPNADSVAPYKNANFWQKWAKPATIEYYDKSKNKVIRFDADIEIYGNYSRAKPQKSFEIKLRDSYGMGSFNYSMWPAKPYITQVDDIILRNSGTDWNKVHFRDGLMERLMKPTFINYLAAEPAIAYLNGQYWGVYHINENHDNHWMHDNYSLSKKEIDYLKEAGTSITVQEGSDESFWKLYNYATTENPATTQYYSDMDKMLDLKIYTDYFVAETFVNNGDWIGDWTNNIMMWRKQKDGEKWKYMLYDLDYGFGLKGDVTDNRLSMARNPVAFSYSSEMFDAVLKNPTYKRYFINRYADLMNTVYLKTNVDKVMHSFKDSMAYDMPAHFAKWGSTMTTWNDYINEMMTFVSNRLGISKNQINAEFHLNGVVTLKFAANPSTGGRIEINTVVPTVYPWTGDYFNGNPITITAIPNPGYKFDHWKSQKVITSNNFNQTLTINFNKDDAITAFFLGTATTPKIAISEINYNSNSDFNSGDWVELHNYTTSDLDISGWKLSDGMDNHMFVFPTGTKIIANGYLVVVEDSVKFRKQFPTVTNWIGELGFNYSNAGDQVRLFKYNDALFLSFSYQETSPWPLLADGEGYTCEHSTDISDPNNGSSWFAGCFGGSPGRAYSTTLAFTPSITGSTTFCSGSSAKLYADKFATTSSTFQWKKNGTSITGAIDSAYAVTLNGTYTVNITNNGCSGLSNGLVMTAVSQQPLPTTTGASRCSEGDITVSATATDSIFWFDAPNGNKIGSGNSLSIPLLSQTTTYYAVNGRNCPSNPVATIAEIMQHTATPVVVDTFRCGPGAITLSASDTADIRWYTSPSGGGLLASGSTFTTGILENDTMYFVEAGTVCPSLRTEISVMMMSTTTPIASDGSRCGDGQVTLYANSTLPLFWFDAANGGNQVGTGNTFLTPSISTPDTFYVEANTGCPSPRVMAIALINPTPSDPVTHDTVSCQGASFQITADATEQLNWYDSQTGGNLIYTGMLYQTPMINSTKTYFVSNGYSCESNRVPMQVIISQTPSAPVAIDQTFCDSGTVVFNASSIKPVSWYDSPTGGILLGIGNTFTSPGMTANSTFYLETGDTCISARSSVNAILGHTGTVSSNNVSRCGDGSVVLSATSNLPGNPIYWYNSPSGGSVLASSSSFTTPILTTDATYYVESGAVCKSARMAVNVTVNHHGTVTANNVSRCDAGTVTLSATSNLPGDSIFWYSSASGINPIATGNTYTTPVLNLNATYYVESGVGTCRSSRIAVNAVVNQTATVASGNVSRCGDGSVVLNATSNSPNNPIFWYSAPSGGNLLASSNSFTTPVLTTNATYYVEAGTTCKSQRIAVNAIVNHHGVLTTSDASRCDGGNIVLSATSNMPADSIFWYSSVSGVTPVATGNTFTTPVLNTNTTYYVESGLGTCRTSRIAVNAFVNNTPIVSASNVDRCGDGTIVLSATTNIPGTPFFWYDSPSGGNLLSSSNSYTTPILTSHATYYVEAGTMCKSQRIAVNATVNHHGTLTTNDASRCNGGSVNLSATSNLPSDTIFWYSSVSGTNLLATGNVFTTPVLNSSKTYYVESGMGTCRTSRIAVNAVINPTATISATNTGRCGNGIIVLTATSNSPGNPIFWYDAPSGGNLLANGNSYTTPFLTANATYYVEAGTTCKSQRIAVNAFVTQNSVVSSNNVNRCDGGTVVLTAISNLQTDSIFWYSSSSGSNIIATGSTFTTPYLNSNATYFVESGSGTCRSSRIPVNANVNTTSVVTTNNGYRCGPGSITLTALSNTPVDSIFWYDAIGGNVVGTGTNFATPVLNTSTTYFVEAHSICTSQPVPAIAIVNQVPTTVTADGFSCGAGSVLLTASSNVPADSIFWYDALGGNVVGTGTTFTTPLLPASRTYYIQAHSICPGVVVQADVIIYDLPVVNLNADTIYIESGESATLDAGAGFSTYSWSTGETTQQITITTPGNYSVVVSDAVGCNGSDQLLVILTTSTGKINSNSFIGLYPNPTSDQITIRLSNTPSRVTMSLVSGDGKTIYREELKSVHGSINKTLSLSGIASGVYYVQVEGENYSRKEKILLNR